jgi:hypothetical protein
MRCQIEGLTVWFARRVGMCAKVDGEVWSGVRRLRVCGSVMESPWLCWVEFAVRRWVVVVVVSRRICLLSTIIASSQLRIEVQLRAFAKHNLVTLEHDTNLRQLLSRPYLLWNELITSTYGNIATTR